MATEQDIANLAALFAGAQHITCLTGAGMSTESGIPDYRDEGGIWARHRPVYFHEFMTSRQARITYWQQKVEFYCRLRATRPNPAHLAIAKLCSMGLVDAVITQNIDGLHQAAGTPGDKVIELHGNGLRVRCMSCGELSPINHALSRVESGDEAPECRCGGFLKPDTISFGQAMPEDELGRAIHFARTAESFIAVGSTLVVQPASHLPLNAKQNGACLAIITLSETPLDQLADIRIPCKAGDALQNLVDRIESAP